MSVSAVWTVSGVGKTGNVRDTYGDFPGNTGSVGLYAFVSAMHRSCRDLVVSAYWLVFGGHDRIDILSNKKETVLKVMV